MEPGRFEGVVGEDFTSSVPWWAPRPRARYGAPNVVLVVLDDVGFAQLGCYGSDIATPALDALSADGLTYTNFHTTALCSPTRACLLTGRNHHRNGMGRIIELATGFPGYDATIPRANGFLSEALLPHGYATFAIGKWHLAPEDEAHAAAPRTNWPLGRGFERFYGYHGGETHQFVPTLFCDNRPIAPPRTPEEGYHLTEDLVDQAIAAISDVRVVDADKPFFLYLATGACHSPHQAPRPWIERYRGAFDEGWDVWRTRTLERQTSTGVLPPATALSPRPDWVPPWDELSESARRLYARYMEAFAGFLTHTDHHLGRLFAFLREIDELDNTLVMVLSDNGASSEGGPTGSVNDLRMWNGAPRTVDEALERIEEIGGPWCHNNYPWGWTVAGNTPFRRWKREVHEGGVADPLLVHWPDGIPAGHRWRRQYVHAVDVTPTVLEALGVVAPASIAGVEQSPMDGTSFAYTFADPDAPARHRVQYYEMLGCRALYEDGWKAVTYHPIQDTSTTFADDRWELYDVEADPSECHDLAAAEPDRLRRLVGRWWEEARRNDVLPLDNRAFSEFVMDKPVLVPRRARYRYRAGAAPVPEVVGPNLRNRAHRMAVRIEVPEREGNGAPVGEGVLLAQGSGLGGWALFLDGGRAAYAHNFVSLREDLLVADDGLVPGLHEVVFHFERTGEHRGVGHLLVDGAEAGRVLIDPFTMARFSLTGAGITCGYGNGLPVSAAYRHRGRFPFTGRILEATIEVNGAEWRDPVIEARDAIAAQ